MSYVCAYIRVSTDDQSLGVEAQKAAIRKYLGQEPHWFVDEGVSGRTSFTERPQLMRLLNAKPTNVYVARRDRLGRDVLQVAIIERELAKHGGTVHAADGTPNDDTAEARLMRTMLDAFAQYERELISARTKAALAVKKAAGAKLGRPRYGSKPDEKALAERIKRSPLDDRTLARQLRREGLETRSGRRWAARDVQRVRTE